MQNLPELESENNLTLEQVMQRLKSAASLRIKREQEYLRKLEELNNALIEEQAKSKKLGKQLKKTQEEYKSLITTYKGIAENLDQPVLDLKTIIGKYNGADRS